MDTETTPGEQIAPEVEDVLVDDGEQIEAAEVILDEDGNPVEPEPETSEEDDTDEIEFDGEKHRIPKALKGAFMLHKDYTFKTEALANERRQVGTALQSVQSALQQAQGVSTAEVQSIAEVIAIDRSIASFATIDWQAYNLADPQAAQGHWMEYQGLKEARQDAVGKYGQAVQQRTAAEQQAQQQRTLYEQQETAKRMEQGNARLTALIPDWGEDKAKSLLAFGQKHYGFSAEELNEFDDPRIVLALNDAFERVQADTKSKTVKKVQTQQAIKPAGKVTGVAAPIRPLDDRASTDAWMKAREKQLSTRKPN